MAGNFRIANYRTTQSHPVYKSGLLIVMYANDKFEIIPDDNDMNNIWDIDISISQFNLSLKNDWIILEK